ncbi:MAG: hypothetical protein LBH04_12275 [Tannerellaceae bacterium]|jgi:hypothetical protein|nr:hypothetical protein [Tannerellaceae bacterium]
MCSQRKYEINTSWLGVNNAALKAPADTDEIYRQNGFRIINPPTSPIMEKLRIGIIRRTLFTLTFLFRFNKNDEVHIQITGSRIANHIIRYIRHRVKKTVLLVHDVKFLRYGLETEKKNETDLYNKADEIIIHTPAMADILKREGVRTPMRILTMFDYLTTSENTYNDPDIRSIVFAGNLQKSKFISTFIKASAEWHLPIYFYGDGKLPEMETYPHTRHEGVFSPHDISQIKGAWGLVWDGAADISTADPYLKYNAPHKLSLYLASGKPVIIWSQSALNSFIVENKLGISVENLLEIPVHLAKLTEKDYHEYKNNVQAISQKLKSGGFLSAHLAG